MADSKRFNTAEISPDMDSIVKDFKQKGYKPYAVVTTKDDMRSKRYTERYVFTVGKNDQFLSHFDVPSGWTLYLMTTYKAGINGIIYPVLIKDDQKRIKFLNKDDETFGRPEAIEFFNKFWGV